MEGQIESVIQLIDGDELGVRNAIARHALVAQGIRVRDHGRDYGLKTRSEMASGGVARDRGLPCQVHLTLSRCQGSLTRGMTNQVREARTVRGISQAVLGEALGVSRQTINAIETGRYLPSLPLAFALARFFETSGIQGLFDPEGASR